MRESDREEVSSMMRIFYASPAVISNGSEEIFSKDIDACVSDDPYLEGYIFERDGKTLGYSMLAKSFSTEFGKHCIWIEDLYLKPEYRGEGVGSTTLLALENLAKEMGIITLSATVDEQNKASKKLFGKYFENCQIGQKNLVFYTDL